MWITLPKPKIGDITVNVTDGTDAISGASVVLTDSDSEDTTKTTGDDGEAVFDDVAPGTYTLSVSKSGYAAPSSIVKEQLLVGTSSTSMVVSPLTTNVCVAVA